METAITFAAFVGGIGLVGFASWLERRPRDLAHPRLLPTTPIMFAGALTALLAAVHLLTLYGISLPGR